MPTVSVVIPAYNAERTILETIASVQQQTFSDFELIVINDGSTDRTVEMLGTVADPRLKVFSYANGRLPVARNRGIIHSTGEFITFIDADDLWTPDKLELQLAALQQHPEAGLVYSWTLVMDENGRNLHPGTAVSFEGNVYSQLLLSNFIASGSNAMLRRQVIESVGEFDPTLRSCEDWDYWLRVAPHWPFAVVPKHQILYRQSSQAMSSKVEVMEQNHLIVHERAFQSAPPAFLPLKNHALANINLFLTRLCLTHVSNATGVQKARESLQRAVCLYPQVLLNKETLSLLCKLLLIEILSPKIANHLLQRINKFRAMNKQEALVESINVIYQ